MKPSALSDVQKRFDNGIISNKTEDIGLPDNCRGTECRDS